MKPRYIEIPNYIDSRGKLCVIDSLDCLPFEIQRIFYIYDIPKNSERGGHAHYNSYQFICCLTGSVTINVYSKDKTSNRFLLSDPKIGLLLPPLNWTSLKANTSNCLYLVAASDFYDESDYINDFKLFSKICDGSL